MNNDAASCLTHLAAGRSLCRYNAPPALFDALVKEWRGRDEAGFSLRLSRLKPDFRLPNAPPAQAVIYQDLPYEELGKQIERLVNQIIFPLWYRRRPICFLSRLPREAYLQKDIPPDAIHDRFMEALGFLLREQLVALLEQPNSRPHPDGNAGRSLYPPDSDLDDDQRQAQEHINGPIRVLAPAGSGKTKTLTNRIVHLLNLGVPGEEILALAFNRKAADEMNQRLAQKGATHVTVRTFHALGYQILRQTLGWRFDGERMATQTRQLLEQAVARHFQMPARRGGDPLDPFLEALRRAKTELPPLAEMVVPMEETEIPFGPIFQTFLRLQNRARLLTFDDMIYLAARIMLKDDALRRAYQSRYRYLLVDEFQDLNKAQLLLMQMLSLPENNIFVVGDDDQMIYGWRGAEIRHIVDFTERFPMAVDCVLKTNYRSSRAIVSHSRRLINHNQERVFKPIRPRAGAQAGSVETALRSDLWAQARAAAGWIEKRRQAGGEAWRHFAILYRYRAYQYPLALALDEQEIPHTEVDLRRLFQTPVGRDIFAYLSLIIRPAEATPAHLSRILKRPNKYLPNQLIETIAGWGDLVQAGQRRDLLEWQQERLQSVTANLSHLSRLAQSGDISAATLLYNLDTAFELTSFYAGQQRQSADLDEETDVILFETLLAVSANFASPAAFYEYARQAITAGPVPSYDEPERDAVVFSTIHQAKGKEWPNVVYFNLSQGAHSSREEEIEEERRVAYVAVTRARESLLVTAIAGKPSPFLAELTGQPETTTRESRR